MATENVAMKPSLAEQPVNPWGSSLDKLKEWDPKGANLLLRVGTNPWTSGVLPRKEVELIYLALNCSCTNLDEAGTRRQIRASLDAGATRDEILLVLKCGVGLAVHSCSLGAPILLEEMKAAGSKTGGGPQTGGPGLRRHARDWSVEYGLGSVLRSLPASTDQFFALGASVYKSGIFTPRFMELISIAFDASITHMYAPGTRRHIQGALKAGATPEEIMTVLQLCVSMGVEACAKSIPILAEELNKNPTS
jgi:alkylhydroperoxidase/carboxymuconolactone decarboxylase family protein YurZ